MRIASSMGSGSTGGATNTSQIESQIEKLETRKRELMQEMSGGGEDSNADALMKQIAMLDMRIANLRQQMGDDVTNSILQSLAKGGNADPASMAEAVAAGKEETAGEAFSSSLWSTDEYPPVAVSEDGHVDGYI